MLFEWFYIPKNIYKTNKQKLGDPGNDLHIRDCTVYQSAVHMYGLCWVPAQQGVEGNLLGATLSLAIPNTGQQHGGQGFPDLKYNLQHTPIHLHAWFPQVFNKRLINMHSSNLRPTNSSFSNPRYPFCIPSKPTNPPWGQSPPKFRGSSHCSSQHSQPRAPREFFFFFSVFFVVSFWAVVIFVCSCLVCVSFCAGFVFLSCFWVFWVSLGLLWGVVWGAFEILCFLWAPSHGLPFFCGK